MEEFLGKEYVMVSEEYFEDYLVFLGVSFIYRKLARTLKPIHRLTRNEDGTYTFILRSSLANSTCTFTPGEKFVETKADGVKVRKGKDGGEENEVEAVITFEDNKMTHIQTEANGRTSKHIRTFYPDKLVITTTAIDFNKTVTRVFELVE